VGEYYYSQIIAGKNDFPMQPTDVRKYLTAAKIWKQKQTAAAHNGLDPKVKADFRQRLETRLKNYRPDDVRRRIVNEALARLPQFSSREELRSLISELSQAGVEIS
jgi:hypothetical protein